MVVIEKQWYVGEDGCIFVGVFVSVVIYYFVLNLIIVLIKELFVKIYDVVFGVLL